MSLKAELLSIGTELLLGQIVDTNANYLAGRLALLGIDCLHMQTVGDNLVRAKQAFERAIGRSDLVVATGGLGPTEDDLTREAIAAALGEVPAVDPALEADLVAWFSGRGMAMPERNRKQAWLIPSSRALPNPNGTAPGWDVQKDGKRIVAMPGVPREMTPMWESVEPSLTRGGSLRWRTLKLLGIGESAVEEQVAESLSAGDVARSLSDAPDAERWFVGAIVRPSAGADSLESEGRRLGGEVLLVTPHGAETSELRVITPVRTRRVDIRFRSPADG